MRTAPIGRRVGARAVDLVVITWLFVVIVVEVEGRILGGDLFARRAIVDVSRTDVIVALVAAVVLLEVLPVVLWGRTPGKAVLGLAVVPADGGQGAAKVGILPAVLRASVLFAPAGVPYVGWVITLAIAVPVLATAERRGLHDRLAGTRVIDVAASR